MFKHLAVISLALLVLVSSTGYSISAHLCGGKAVSYSLFGCPADCGEGEEGGSNDHCDHTIPAGETGFQSQQCCSNQTIVFSGLSQLTQVVNKIFALSPAVAEAMNIFHFPLKSTFASSVKPQFADYQSPALVRDLSVLLLVFRI
ncbi:MAG: hypothetical protein DYG98_15830 [Haliscomenobacteraceae bacterium CHB4]|nr:hypothetical protein [Saprospiraceae bacterium]MCE7924516.1 hypothetical protein [Haliscomenobacteraceae bacterium CHB4]